MTSLPAVVNPAAESNCYGLMPFRKRARITHENLIPSEIRDFYYRIDYALTVVSEDTAY